MYETRYGVRNSILEQSRNYAKPISGPVITRPMTKEDIEKYGEPVNYIENRISGFQQHHQKKAKKK